MGSVEGREDYDQNLYKFSKNKNIKIIMHINTSKLLLFNINTFFVLKCHFWYILIKKLEQFIYLKSVKQENEGHKDKKWLWNEDILSESKIRL